MSTAARPLPRPESLLSFGWGKRLPVILQTEAAECGLACLAMVTGYYGNHTSINELRADYGISSHGLNLSQLIEIASDLDMVSRPLKLDLEHLTQLQTPCILHWEMNHFVVLKKVKNNKLVIHDPAIGERIYTMEEVSASFTGVALELIPTREFTATPKRPVLKLSQLWSGIKGLRRSLAIVLVLSLLLQGFSLVSPYYLQTIIDDVLLRNDANLLTVLAIGFGLLLCIEVMASLLRQFVVLSLSSRLNMQMSANVFRHLIRLPVNYFSKRHIGDVISRFSSLSEIRELLTTSLVAAILDGFMAVITLLVMFLYDERLAFLVLGIVSLYAVLRYLLYRPFRLLKEEQIVASAKEQTHFMESVRAIQTIKLFEKETLRQGQWQNKLADVMNKHIRISHWQFGYESANRFLFGLENVLVIYFAAHAVMDNLMTVGMLYAFISYKTRFVSAMDGLINTALDFKLLELHLSRLGDIVSTEADPVVERETSHHSAFDKQLSAPKGSIRVESLAYRFSPVEADIFDKVDLTISAGETIAITGASGSGKTTLLKCLMGLVQPSSGEIFIDDIPLTNFVRYREHIAAVLQDDQLLSGSIAENIACFADQIDMRNVVQAAHQACIHEEIGRMSMQYNTLVGDMGSGMSGRQKQRILLARALYKKPQILFMDEATSHLDTENESQISDHIKRLNITRIIVAHRPETIRSATRVFRLANGRLDDISQNYFDI